MQVFYFLLQNREETKSQHKKMETLDKGALNGLRGFFAFHVMAYHALMEGRLHGDHNPTIYIYANVDMPLFFLLSGFSLALAYGKTLWNGSTSYCFGSKISSKDGADLETSDPKIFDSWTFYKKRMIRILPLYYLGHILMLIVWRLG